MRYIFTTTEASTVLGVQPKMVTHYIERGIIAAEKRGRDYFISAGEIERFKRERRGRGKPKSTVKA